MRWVEDVGPDVDMPAMRAASPWLTPLERRLTEHGWTPAAGGAP
jgi:hypothetical protein